MLDQGKLPDGRKEELNWQAKQLKESPFSVDISIVF